MSTHSGSTTKSLHTWTQDALRRASTLADAKLPPRAWRERRDWRLPPTPVGLPWVGPAAQHFRQPLQSLPYLQSTLGDSFAFRAGPYWLSTHLHPDHVQHVLHDRHRNFNKDTRGYHVLQLVLGQGLLTADGDTWLANRRLAQPAFHRARIQALSHAMSRAAEDLLVRWKNLAHQRATVDVAAEMMRVTLRIVCETVLGVTAQESAGEVAPALTVVLRETEARIHHLVDVPEEWPTPSNRRLREATATLDRMVEGIIQARRARVVSGESSGDDLLGLLMAAQDADTGARMNDRQLRDEVMTMFLAGHETTANLLAWTFSHLGRHPALARALRDETHARLGGRAATMEDFEHLPLTDAILQESLRLSPPAWIIDRNAIEDDVIGGYDVPAGTTVLISPWMTHRHPDFWDHPLGFDPFRFLDHRPTHRWAFFPFGGGPRLCIGQHFALVEARILLATLAQSVLTELLPGHEPEPEPVITMRPRFGLPMRLRAAV